VSDMPVLVGATDMAIRSAAVYLDLTPSQYIAVVTSNPRVLSWVVGTRIKPQDVVWLPGWTQGQYAEVAHDAIFRECDHARAAESSRADREWLIRGQPALDRPYFTYLFKDRDRALEAMELYESSEWDVPPKLYERSITATDWEEVR
jgi:type 1 glutamine amidotransferase